MQYLTRHPRGIALEQEFGGAGKIARGAQPLYGVHFLNGVAHKGLPGGQPYSATKAAIINLAESLRVEVAKENIDVRLINPGFVKTPLTDKNDFSMPMMIEAEAAARAIADGLIGKNFETHFPKKFTFIMKILSLLPYNLYFPLACQIKR